MHESGGYLLSTNAQGFRSQHNFQPQRTDKKRVLLFGDSYSAGMGVSDARCYAALIEQQHPEWEIYNLSLPGTGTDQHYLIFRDYAAQLEFDAVVLAVQVENIRRVNSRIRPFEDVAGKEILLEKPYFSLVNNQLVLKQYPPRCQPLEQAELSPDQLSGVERGGRFELARKTINKLGKPIKMAIQKITKIQPLPEYATEESSSWQLMRAILSKWISQLKQPVILMPVPLYHYIEGLADPGPCQDRFMKLAADTGAKLVDPLPALTARPEAEKRAMRFEHDVHPTALMHTSLAKVLGPHLAEVLRS